MALARLVDVGAVRGGGGRVLGTGAMNVAAALERVGQKAEREGEVERSRLTMMRNYAEYPGCRRSFLLTYFGQDFPDFCGNCDNDLARAETGQAAAAQAEVPFRVGTQGSERALG